MSSCRPIWCAGGAGFRRGGGSGRRAAGFRKPLWAMAIRLAKAHGVSRTAAVLGLDYYRLKKRAEAAASEPQSSGPAFVELTPPVLVAKQCRFELDNGSGATMRVQLVGYDAADVEALVAQLLERPVMLQITPQMKILVAVEPADFRRGIDGLARLCQETLQHDPFAGAVFVFRNRKATALKLLMYDGQGFWLCHKRLSQGRFPWWPSAADGGAQRLAAHQLAVLLSAGDPTRTGAAADWRPVGPPT